MRHFNPGSNRFSGAKLSHAKLFKPPPNITGQPQSNHIQPHLSFTTAGASHHHRKPGVTSSCGPRVPKTGTRSTGCVCVVSHFPSGLARKSTQTFRCHQDGLPRQLFNLPCKHRPYHSSVKSGQTCLPRHIFKQVNSQPRSYLCSSQEEC